MSIFMKFFRSEKVKNIVFNNKFLYILFIIIYSNYKYRFDKTGMSKRELAKLLPSNPSIVEVGAYTGGDTVEMAIMWPKGKIYAFEPVPQLFDELRMKTRFFNNIKVYNYAVSNKESSSVDMFVSSNGCSSSLLEPSNHLIIHPDINFENKVKVEAIVLSNWMRSVNIDSIDLLWIDAQGMELNILNSMGGDIEKVKLIYTEVSVKEFYKDSVNYEELKKFLATYNFELLKDDLNQGDLMGNAIFKRASI